MVVMGRARIHTGGVFDWRGEGGKIIETTHHVVFFVTSAEGCFQARYESYLRKLYLLLLPLVSATSAVRPVIQRSICIDKPRDDESGG